MQEQDKKNKKEQSQEEDEALADRVLTREGLQRRNAGRPRSGTTETNSSVYFDACSVELARSTPSSSLGNDAGGDGQAADDDEHNDMYHSILGEDTDDLKKTQDGESQSQRRFKRLGYQTLRRVSKQGTYNVPPVMHWYETPGEQGKRVDRERKSASQPPRSVVDLSPHQQIQEKATVSKQSQPKVNPTSETETQETVSPLSPLPPPPESPILQFSSKHAVEIDDVVEDDALPFDKRFSRASYTGQNHAADQLLEGLADVIEPVQEQKPKSRPFGRKTRSNSVPPGVLEADNTRPPARESLERFMAPVMLKFSSSSSGKKETDVQAKSEARSTEEKVIRDLTETCTKSMSEFRDQLAQSSKRLQADLHRKEKDISLETEQHDKYRDEQKRFKSRLRSGNSGFLQPTVASVFRAEETFKKRWRVLTSKSSNNKDSASPAVVSERLLKPTLSWSFHTESATEERTQKLQEGNRVVDTSRISLPHDLERRLLRDTESSTRRVQERGEEERRAKEKEKRMQEPLSPRESKLYSKLSSSETASAAKRIELLEKSFVLASREDASKKQNESFLRNIEDDDFQPAEFEKEMDELFSQAFSVPERSALHRRMKKSRAKKMFSTATEAGETWGARWGIRGQRSGIWVGPANGILRTEEEIEAEKQQGKFVTENSRQMLKHMSKPDYKEHTEAWTENFRRARELEKNPPPREKNDGPEPRVYAEKLARLRDRLEQERSYEAREASSLVSLLASLPNGFREQVEAMIDRLPNPGIEADLNWQCEEVISEHQKIHSQHEPRPFSSSSSSKCPTCSNTACLDVSCQEKQLLNLKPVEKDLYHPESVDKHVERVRAGRKEREETARRLEQMGTANRWTPKTTVCKPFKLSQSQKASSSHITEKKVNKQSASGQNKLANRKYKKTKPKVKKSKTMKNTNVDTTDAVHHHHCSKGERGSFAMFWQDHSQRFRNSLPLTSHDLLPPQESLSSQDGGYESGVSSTCDTDTGSVNYESKGDFIPQHSLRSERKAAPSGDIVDMPKLFQSRQDVIRFLS